MNKKTVTTLSASAVIVAVTVVLMTQMLTPEQRSVVRAADTPTTAGAKPVRVEVAKPDRRPLTRALRMPASLLPGKMAELYAKTSGYVVDVAVDIGDQVKKGDALITIDVPEMMDELRQAEAVLAARRARVQALRAKAVQAESMVAIARAEVQRYAAEHDLWKVTLDRKRQLKEANAIPEQDFDEARSRFAVVEAQSRIAEARVASAVAEKQSVEADVAVARSEAAVEEARLARLRTLMKYATIRAPFDGVITERGVDPGAFVRSAAEGVTNSLLTIANVSFIRLVIEIPESDAPFVRVGTEVNIDVKALNMEPITAAITRTARSLKVETRTMRTEVDLDNGDGRFAPGMYAQVAVILEVKQQAMLIPSKAIRVTGRDLFVLVARGAVAESIPVKIGYDDGIWAEVLSGLSGDEQVIVSTAGAVAAGAPVAPVDLDRS